MDECSAIDISLVEANTEPLAYVAPRVGAVNEAFDLTINVLDWEGVVTRFRIDTHRNTFAECYRQRPNAEFTTASFDFVAAEEELWNDMTTPLDEVQMIAGQFTIEVPPESVTMLRIKNE